MDKNERIKRILACGVVAVVRVANPKEALLVAKECARAGIVGIEVTYTVPGASEAIKDLCRAFPDEEVIIGAGTVLDPETARDAILAGAKFIVSPSLNVETIKLCNRYQIASMPGAMTIKEVVECLEAGADIVKVFPGEVLGPAFIKAVKGPLPYAKLMPTGGVNLDNTQEWIKAGAVVLGVGGSLTRGIKDGDYSSVYEEGKKYVEAVRRARDNG